MIHDDFKLNGHCEQFVNRGPCRKSVADSTVKLSLKKFGKVYCFYHWPIDINETIKGYKSSLLPLTK